MISRPFGTSITSATGKLSGAFSFITFISVCQELARADFQVSDVTWDENLSCHQCIRAGFKYVYENVHVDEGVFFKDYLRGSTPTGYCCLDEDFCEVVEVEDDSDVTEMWLFYDTADTDLKTEIENYLIRVRHYEGDQMYRYFIDKLIAMQYLPDVADYEGSGNLHAVVALSNNLRNRVLFNEMKFAVGPKMALEYMDLISDVAEYASASAG